MQIVKFVLSGFWTWAGAVGLIAFAAVGAAVIIKAIRPTRKIDAHKLGNRWHIEIDGATAGDIAAVMDGTAAAEVQDAAEESE